jgi:RNA polymerase sigma-70 factor (ECF subfamily)
VLEVGPAPADLPARASAMTDEMLVAAIAHRDEAAFTILYDRYVRAVCALAIQVVQEHEVAEELTQEVFLRLWRHAAVYRVERGRFASWLFGITHNLAIDELRRRRRRLMVVTGASATMRLLPDTQTDVEETACLTVQREEIDRALRQLPLPQRRVIALAYLGGLTHAEIAALLGTPLGTVKTRLRLGIARLRLLLSASAPGEWAEPGFPQRKRA